MASAPLIGPCSRAPPSHPLPPAVALVYYFFDPHGITNDPHLSTVITTTLVVVLISILIFGAATKPLLAYLMGTEEGGAQHGGWQRSH